MSATTIPVPKTRSLVFPVLIFALVFLCAFGRALLRTQTILIGYEIGELKKKEGELLAQRSQLKMELAKITTKQNLLQLSEHGKGVNAMGDYAQQ